MAADEFDSPASKSTSVSNIPPPTDPYVTFQTPYPRKPSEESQNPFIEFRRLADSAFSSFFSGLPKLLGTEQFKENNIRQSEQDHINLIDHQVKEFGRQVTEIARARAEDVEGVRKRLEQDWEERRQENKSRVDQESRRWDMMRRGMERCPVLKSAEGDTARDPDSELDLYNRLGMNKMSAFLPRADRDGIEPQAYSSQDERPHLKCAYDEPDLSQSGWLNGLGFDGRRRAGQTALSPLQDQQMRVSSNVNVKWQEYKDEHMDPFTNDDHLVPWLKLSHYSPLSLVTGQVSGGTGHMDLSEIPWDEAFEDLISIHKTGRLPSLTRRLIYWGGPNQWITEMALRGSLGSNWGEGVMVAALMSAVQGNRWRGFNGFEDQCINLAGHVFNRDSVQSQVSHLAHPFQKADEQDSPEDLYSLAMMMRDLFESSAVHPYQRTGALADPSSENGHLPDKAFGAHGMFWPSPEDVITASSPASLSESKRKSTSTEADDEVNGNWSNVRESLTSSSIRASSSSYQDKQVVDSPTSTLTITTARTLPDGSLETKKIFRQRFADGREEERETTEIKSNETKLVDNASMQNAGNEETKPKVNGGWFWS